MKISEVYIDSVYSKEISCRTLSILWIALLIKSLSKTQKHPPLFASQCTDMCWVFMCKYNPTLKCEFLKAMDLNKMTNRLPISLSFWVRLILNLCLKAYRVPQQYLHTLPHRSPSIHLRFREQFKCHIATNLFSVTLLTCEGTCNVELSLCTQFK